MTFTDEQKALMNNERTVKTMRIEFDNPTFNSIDANHIYQESLEIEESLFDGELRFGKCNASMFKTKIADINEDIIGQTIYPYITFTLGNDTLDVPFGQYIIQSAERTSDRRWLMITAVDQMSLFDVDIAEWYNTVLYPTDSTTRTVKYIRDELCSYINIEQATVTLANDDLVIPKTINPDSLSARDLLQAICELNGCFGHFDWEGVLQYIFMQEDGLYPSETLYPSDDLFPRNGHASSVSDEYISVYKNCDFADYTVKRIDSVAILKEDGSLAVHYEPSENYENRYIISGNILLYGFNTTQLQSIAATIYEEISDSAFVPNTTEVFGCAYMQLGQDYTVVTRYYSGSNVIERQIESFFIKRTIHGIQAMFSTIVSEGTEYLPKVQTNDVLSEMTILRGKSAKYERDLEHLSSELIDYEEQTNSLIKQTANEITLSVAKSSDIWDEVDGQGNPLNITSRDYISIPSNNKVVIPIGDPIPFEGMNINDYYLDLSTGKVYTLSDIGATTSGITFTFSIPILNQNINQLNKTKSVLQSQITQNANSITLEVSRATGAESTLNSKIDQTAESITLEVAASQGSWIEENSQGVPIYIRYRDYGDPPTEMPYSFNNNDYYLNVTTGQLYRGTITSVGETTKTVSWTLYRWLTSTQAYTKSRIEQLKNEINLSVSDTQNIWIEEYNGSVVTLKYRGYSAPISQLMIDEWDLIFPDDLAVNDLYLDMTDGKVYKATNITYQLINYPPNSSSQKRQYTITWVYQYTLDYTVNALHSEIRQTADSITLEVSKDQVVWLEESPIGTPLSIKYRDYSAPRTTVTSDEYNLYFPDGLAVNDLYLNMLNGVVAKVTAISTDASTGAKTITWNTSYKVLDKAEEHLISRINQTAEQITIQASKISLEGIVTANQHFKILSDGSMECNDATLKGNFKVKNTSNQDVIYLDNNGNAVFKGELQSTSGSIGGWDIGSTSIYSTGGSSNNHRAALVSAETSSFDEWSTYAYSTQFKDNGTWYIAFGVTYMGEGYFREGLRIPSIRNAGIDIGDPGAANYSYIGQDSAVFKSNYQITAAQFNGALNGNATTATAADKVKTDVANVNVAFYQSGVRGAPQYVYGATESTDGSAYNVHPYYAWSSDRRIKKDIKVIDSKYEDFYMNLKPVKFKYKDDDTDVIHLGFIAQEVLESMENCDISEKEFYGLQYTDHSKTESGLKLFQSIYPNMTDIYNLDYEQFIPLNTMMIQKLYKRIEELENTIKEITK